MDRMKAGTRWDCCQKKFLVHNDLIEEDSKCDPDRLTAKIVLELMNNINPDLKLTTEICQDYTDGWMLSLDCKLGVRDDGVCEQNQGSPVPQFFLIQLRGGGAIESYKS